MVEREALCDRSRGQHGKARETWTGTPPPFHGVWSRSSSVADVFLKNRDSRRGVSYDEEEAFARHSRQ